MDRRKELDLINSKKYSFNEKKLLFIGVVNNTIYDKTLFSNNKLLNNYIKLFEKTLHLKEPYKEYLYSSRTLLASRVSRDLLNSDENSELLKSIDSHTYFIDNNFIELTNKNKIKMKNQKNRSLLDDMIQREK